MKSKGNHDRSGTYLLEATEKSYMTEEIESEELENIKCHHFPRTSQCILFSVNAIHIIMYHKLQC